MNPFSGSTLLTVKKKLVDRPQIFYCFDWPIIFRRDDARPNFFAKNKSPHMQRYNGRGRPTMVNYELSIFCVDHQIW